MTQDEIMSLWNEHADGMNGDTLIRFANAVAAKEREACAKVCESYLSESPHSWGGTTMSAAIRARGQA